MPKCDFNKVIKKLGCSPVSLLHIFRAPFLKNTSGGLLLSWNWNWKHYMGDLYSVCSSQTPASYCPPQPLTAWKSKAQFLTAMFQSVFGFLIKLYFCFYRYILCGFILCFSMLVLSVWSICFWAKFIPRINLLLKFENTARFFCNFSLLFIITDANCPLNYTLMQIWKSVDTCVFT